MPYDIIFISGERFFDHPLCGIAILKRLLEKHGYSVGVIEMPAKEDDVKSLGRPNLFFGVSSGGIDSMLKNYTPLKKLRRDDPHAEYTDIIPDRTVIVYCNWLRRHFKDSVIVIGGVEASLRRFVHYDYWDNKLRKPILFDSRADILVYGNAEKQVLEIASRLKNQEKKQERKQEKIQEKKEEKTQEKKQKTKQEILEAIEGTCIISKSAPADFIELPSFEEASNSAEKFCSMQMMLSNKQNLAQKVNNRHVLQYKSPTYTSKDLDEYYEFPFTRSIPSNMQGFRFSIVTHRGCIGECNFCSLKLLQGDRIISRSEKSILKEITSLTKHSGFRGNIDDIGGPSANMYGMDCNECSGSCIDCKKLDRSNGRLIELLKKARKIKGVKKINIRSGIRYDLVSAEYLRELCKHHILDTLRIAPEHVDNNVLKLMNKDRGNLDEFIRLFNSVKKTGELSFYFMTAHPGSSMKEAVKLGNAVKGLANAGSVQVFTPTPMTVSTCMYYTGIDPKSKKKIYVPYAYSEKKQQKRAVLGGKELEEKELGGKE
ncbi:MAG: YgiQ family radical SAM protein [Candidatus Woesearchaeota archaeon]